MGGGGQQDQRGCSLSVSAPPQTHPQATHALLSQPWEAPPQGEVGKEEVAEKGPEGQDPSPQGSGTPRLGVLKASG